MYVCMCVYICVCMCVCVCVSALRKLALGVTGLDFVYIMLYTDYVQFPWNHFSSHVFLCTRKCGIFVTKHILDKSWVMNLYIVPRKFKWCLLFTALNMIVTNINSKDINPPFITSINFQILTWFVIISFNTHLWSHHVSPAQPVSRGPVKHKYIILKSATRANM